MEYKTFLKWYSPVFFICLGLIIWLMYYQMFLKDNYTLTTAYVDEMTYADGKYFIEVNYYPNMFEVKLNYYTDTQLPDKQADGTYGDKYTYSAGVQFDGGYQFTRELDSNYFSYDYYYNKMANCYYYNTTNDGTSYTAIAELQDLNHWVYDINGNLCLIEEKGNVTESYFLWVSRGSKYDTSLMIADLYESVKSLEDGQRVIAFDLSKYYNVRLYDGERFATDIYETSETLVFVNIKVNKSSNTFVSATQSMFGKFKGDSNWTLYDIEKADYWRCQSEYNFTIKDFTIAYENKGYYLKLQQNVIDFFSEFSNMKYIVTIDLDNVYLGSEKIKIDGFVNKPFGSLTMDKIILKTEETRSFKTYGNYNFIYPENLTIEKLGVAK